MRFSTYFIVFQLLSFGAFAQYQKTPLFHDNDVITLEFIPNDGYYYSHKIEKGNTIYSLSRTFNVSVASILNLNGMKRDTPVDINQVVKIPVDPMMIYQGEDVSALNGKYVPVYYQVKPRETLFRIAKMYFNQEVQTLKNRNNLNSNNLEIGDRLLIGWIPVEGTTLPSTIVKDIIDEQEKEVAIQETKTKVLEEIQHSTKVEANESSAYDDKSTIIKIVHKDSTAIKEMPVEGKELLGSDDKMLKVKRQLTKQNTVAHWDKNIPDNGVAYALHNEAIPNTYIELYNPNLKRSIRAKVIGKIPFGSYTSDVELVISPRAARLLGGLDQRFRVEAKYFK